MNWGTFCYVRVIYIEIIPDACRDAGGSFGKMEAAQEEQYFRKLVSCEFCDIFQ